MYIGDYLGRREIYSPEKLAIIDAGKTPEQRLTFRAWNRRVNRLANWLRSEAGVGYRDRVAILAQDGVEHLDLFHACSKLGAIHTALNWRLHWRELAGIAANTTPRVLVYSDKFKEAVTEIVQAAAGGGHAIFDKFHLLQGVAIGINGQFDFSFDCLPDQKIGQVQAVGISIHF